MHKTPDPNIPINSLTDAERDNFNHLLNWAYADYIARISNYNAHWTYVRNHNPPTPRLDHNTSQDSEHPMNFPYWVYPKLLPDVD